AAGLCELIGICAAAAPRAWLTLFDNAPDMIDAGSRYLQVVGPVYGLFGLGMALYFASQGAGRMLWPFCANLIRLLIAAGGGYIALRLSGSLTGVFVALAVALCAFGLINAAAVASGSWFDKPLRVNLPPQETICTNAIWKISWSGKFSRPGASASIKTRFSLLPGNSIRSPIISMKRLHNNRCSV